MINRKLPILTIILLSNLLSAPCTAAIYLWKDSAGNAHYTNKDYEIPERFRSQVKILYPDTANSAPNQQGVPAEQQRPTEQIEQVAAPQAPLATSTPERLQHQQKPEKSGRARRKAVKED